MPTIGVILLSIVTAASSWWGGYVFARRRFGVAVHVHAYEQWQDYTIREGKYRQGEWVVDLVRGQKRDCLGCGVCEIRAVTIDEVV